MGVAAVIFVLGLGPVYAQGLLPNAQQQFLDFNGAPLAGGFVYMYVPGTTTPSTTWQNQALTVANTNPIQLDAAGEARIWSNGTTSYRQVVTKSDGSLVWDQVTTVNDGNIRGPASSINGDLVSWNGIGGVLIADSGIATSGGNIVMTGNISTAALTVAGNTSIGGTLGVAGATTLAGLTVNGVAGFNSAVGVNNVLNTITLSVSGNAGVGGFFGVTGSTTLAGALVAEAAVQMTGLTVTPTGKQPLCIDVSTGILYLGTGGAC